MINGYKIYWTEFALTELEKTIEYLKENWSDKELENLALDLEKTLSLLSHQPTLFQVSDIKKDVRRVVVSKFNTLYYRMNGNKVEILSFFSNRQHPKRRGVR
jgi:plasmid stabilization system protein ParE